MTEDASGLNRSGEESQKLRLPDEVFGITAIEFDHCCPTSFCNRFCPLPVSV